LRRCRWASDTALYGVVQLGEGPRLVRCTVEKDRVACERQPGFDER
jgi:hypothetical protein